ncbi:hypothetical protein P9112_009000 [Eukaryota sp. TZLM1-RC]
MLLREVTTPISSIPFLSLFDEEPFAPRSTISEFASDLGGTVGFSIIENIGFVQHSVKALLAILESKLESITDHPSQGAPITSDVPPSSAAPPVCPPSGAHPPPPSLPLPQ